MANKIKFKQGKKGTLPSFQEGSLLAVRDEPSLYLDAENGFRHLIATAAEGNLQWGGKNHSGSFGPVDAALIPCLGANRFAFLPPEMVEIEQSRDGGATWQDYSDPEGRSLTGLKKTLVSEDTNVDILIGGRYGDLASGIDYSQDCTRITITTSKIINGTKVSTYSALSKFAIYINTNYSQNCTVSIDARTQLNTDNNVDSWVPYCNNQRISGWPGWNIINTETIYTYGNTSTQFKQIRFTFRHEGLSSGTSNRAGLLIYKIKAFGGPGWSTPSTMASRGRLYSTDPDQGAIFPQNLSANIIIARTGFSGNLSGVADEAKTLTWNEF